MALKEGQQLLDKLKVCSAALLGLAMSPEHQCRLTAEGCVFAGCLQEGRCQYSTIPLDTAQGMCSMSIQHRSCCWLGCPDTNLVAPRGCACSSCFADMFVHVLQVKLIQLPAVPPNNDTSSPTAQQELQLARKHPLNMHCSSYNTSFMTSMQAS